MRNENRPTVTRVWFNGRQFNRVTWHDTRVTVVWGNVHENGRVWTGVFMGRREI